MWISELPAVTKAFDKKSIRQLSRKPIIKQSSFALEVLFAYFIQN
jgi:hypothetical protein